MTTIEPARRPGSGRAERAVGAVVGIAVNAVALWFVTNLPDWELLRFVTDAWSQVVGVVALSITAQIAASVGTLVDDRRTTRAATQVLAHLVGIAATWRVLRVFPFDFSTYAFDWTPLLRVALVVGVVGTGIALVVELIRLASGGPPAAPGVGRRRDR